MTDFLLEIFSEEIPARMQKNAAANFASIAFETLTRAGLIVQEKQIKTFIAPRRLALYIDNLEDEQVVAPVKKIGPKTDADPKALEGFLRSVGLKNKSELEIVDHNGSACYLFQKPASSTKTLTIIEGSLSAIMQKMTAFWPKIMRFDLSSGEQSKWIRPIRNILCLYGARVVNFEFAGFKANNLSFGHLLAGSKALKINACEQYQNILRDNFVIVDQNERKEKIIAQIHKIKFAANLETIDDEEKSALFDEVNGLCEWPTALVAHIDQKYMSLPKEVLILTLKLNQKYFCLQDKNGNLSTKFIFISNALIDAKNSVKIIADNEKVVRARLSDAKFFVDEDLKIPLIKRKDDLENIIFHQKLGSIYDRVDRIENLAELLSIWIAHCDISLVKRAANLCKADLVTKAVAELPELQGKIGSFYAVLQNENNKIAQAIYEHYLPLGPSSELPATPLGAALAIADKVDLIVGLFLANEKPTSSKDPFALRRAALGIIRISLSYNINLPLKVLIRKSLKLYKPKLLESLLKEHGKAANQKEKLVEEIIKFLFERLKSFLKENKQVRGDVINAAVDEYVAKLDGKEYCDLLIVAKKAMFLDELVKKSENIGIIQLYKRSANVLAIEEKKDGCKYEKKPSVLALKTKYEKSINNIIKKISPEFTKLSLKGDFDAAFKLLQLLELPLTHFFDHVIVNDKNKKLRENRLLLLAQIRLLFNEVADLSKIEV